MIRALAPVYPSDVQFREAFAEKIIRTGQGGNKRLVRYILSRIERQIAEHDIDPDSDHFSIEHVLPEHPGDGWECFSDQDIERFLYRLGNMTLMERVPNRELGAAPYDEKKDVYRSSSVRMTQRLPAEYDSWMPASIASNQRRMAKEATAVWRLPLLSDGVGR